MKNILVVFFLLLLVGCYSQQSELTKYVNPFLGTAPLENPQDIGYAPPEGWRVWAGLTFPGASLPNAMVQLSPVTQFGSGAGYEYEDSVIYAFTHTNKGHWNLCHIPVLPVCGSFEADDFGSGFSHQNEIATPGYYSVFLNRYNVTAELTSTLRCGYHKYLFPANSDKNLLLDFGKSNEKVRSWDIEKVNSTTFKGYQETGSKIYFYAKSNLNINSVASLKKGDTKISVISFDDENDTLEIKIGLSFVSYSNAKENLEKELAGKTFSEVKNDASSTWEDLLSKINVTGGTDREKELFYSSLYRSFLWPALRSDVNGEFINQSGEVVKKDFNYYTKPSLWDTYRNKLVLMEILTPEVTSDVIQSLIDRGRETGFIPTFFHGDHAAPFISGAWLRGVRGFDIKSAYNLLFRNATLEGGTRPYIKEYIEKGFISTPSVDSPIVETHAKAGVTKTLEYAYDDYSLALLSRELKKPEDYRMLMRRGGNYKHLFDSSTGFMRGRLEDGNWVKNFNPEYPYYEYMYREANAWQSSFFVPHDTQGLIELYGGKKAFEEKLDSLFSISWNENYIARNVSSFIGQYCHGNQPDHSSPYLYYFVDKQPKSQAIIDSIMNHFYGMGDKGLALCGMDDAGEMSSWYVFNAIGLYPYSPADSDYIVTVPVFDKIEVMLPGDGKFIIAKKGSGQEIKEIDCNGNSIEGYFITHEKLLKYEKLVVSTK
jgi:predicted alpha-1,2-mannosidase